MADVAMGIVVFVIIIIIIEGYSTFTTALYQGVPLLQIAYVDFGLFSVKHFPS
jgi:hypothetical protein